MSQSIALAAGLLAAALALACPDPVYGQWCGGTGSGGASGGGVTSGDGAGGADPYRPGENKQLAWKSDVEGPDVSPANGAATLSEKPLLVFLYSGDMAKDCCAANFERAVFRYRPVVQLAEKFECFRLVYGQETGLVPDVKLETAKPAIVLLDGERTLIHKQQRCVDPKAYVGILKDALLIHEKRFRQREGHVARVAEAHKRAEAREFRKALSLLDGLLAKRIELTKEVLASAEKERADIIAAGKAALESANALRAGGKLDEARAAYARLREEFVAVAEIYKPATKAVIEVEAALKK